MRVLKAIGAGLRALAGIPAPIGNIADVAAKAVTTVAGGNEETQLKMGELIVEWMRASVGEAPARRAIALIVVGLWAAGIAGASVAALAGDLEAAHVMKDQALEMSDEVAIVLGFYFLGPHAERLITQMTGTSK